MSPEEANEEKKEDEKKESPRDKKSDDTPRKKTDSPIVKKNDTPRSKDETPTKKNDTPRSKNDTPNKKNDTPRSKESNESKKNDTPRSKDSTSTKKSDASLKEEKIEYKVQVRTDDEISSGIDANVFISLFGTTGELKDLALKHADSKVDAFEKGRLDNFEFNDLKNIGKLTKISIGHDSKDQAWKVEYVNVIYNSTLYR